MNQIFERCSSASYSKNHQCTLETVHDRGVATGMIEGDEAEKIYVLAAVFSQLICSLVIG